MMLSKFFVTIASIGVIAGLSYILEIGVQGFTAFLAGTALYVAISVAVEVAALFSKITLVSIDDIKDFPPKPPTDD